jgi:site-specific DNA-methyltransferase (adenine-specific)
MKNFKLHMGNCIDFLKKIPDQSIDNIFADPPYGNETNYKSYKDTRDNLEKLINSFMPEAKRVAKRIIITCGVKNIYLYPEYDWSLCWVNMAGVGSSSWGFCCWQPILVYGKDPYLSNGLGRKPDTYIQKQNKNDRDVDHPCPKPENVMRWIIDRTTIKNETILDPFMGSGSTGIACAKLDRDFIGCEIDPYYFEIAKKQIENSQQCLL